MVHHSAGDIGGGQLDGGAGGPLTGLGHWCCWAIGGGGALATMRAKLFPISDITTTPLGKAAKVFSAQLDNLAYLHNGNTCRAHILFTAL